MVTFHFDNVTMNNSTLFNWTTTRQSDATPSHQSLDLWLVIFLSVVIFGVAGNGLLLIVIARSRALRTGTGVLIMHLIASNLIMCAIHFPIHVFLVYGRTHAWFSPTKIVCTFLHYPHIVTVFVSSWADATLAINRFIATICPYHHQAWTRLRVCLVMVTMCWVFSIATTVPITLGSVAGDFAVTPFGQCVFLYKSRLGGMLASVNFYTPYAVVGLVALAILCKLATKKLCARRVTEGGPGRWEQVRQTAVFNRRIKLARILLLSFLFCVACTLAMSITTGYNAAQSYSMFSLWLRICSVSQYAFSPVFFFAGSQDYRNGIVRLFRNLRQNVTSAAPIDAVREDERRTDLQLKGTSALVTRKGHR